jgi:hypothetical protein
MYNLHKNTHIIFNNDIAYCPCDGYYEYKKNHLYQCNKCSNIINVVNFISGEKFGFIKYKPTNQK